MASKLIQLPSRQEMWWRLRLVDTSSHLEKLYIEITTRCANQTLTPGGLVQRLMDAVGSYERKESNYVPSVLIVERLPQYLAAILDDPRNRVGALEALRVYRPPQPTPPHPQRQAREHKRAENSARRKARGKSKQRHSTSLDSSIKAKRLDNHPNKGDGPQSDS